MKKTLFLAVAAVTALFSACSSDELASSANDSNVVNVSFSANFDQVMPTRSVSGDTDGTQATTLYVAVYNANKELIKPISKIGVEGSEGTVPVSGKAATVNFQLVKGQTYSFAFWAQNSSATALAFDAENKKVTINYGKANDETLDAFTAHVNNLKVTGAIQQSVTLKRPWAQVNFGATQADVKAAHLAGIDIKKTKVTVNNVFKTLNLLDGTVADPETADFELALNAIPAGQNQIAVDVDGTNTQNYGKLTVNATDYAYMGLNYLLVGGENDTQSLIKADLSLYKDGDDTNPVNTLAFSNVPVQRNYRTNIVGNLLTSQTQFSITIDPNYEEPDYVVSIADQAALDATIDAINKGTSAPTAITLDPVIDNATFDFSELESTLENTPITIAANKKVTIAKLDAQKNNDMTPPLTVGNGSTVNIVDSKLSSAGTNTSDVRAVNVGNNAVVHISGTTIDGGSAAYSRGLNLIGTGSTVIIDSDSDVKGTYAINLPSAATNNTVVINGATIEGWAVLNIWNSGNTFEFNNCTLNSTNDKTYNAEGWNNFCAFKFNTGASNNTVTVNDCVITVTATTGNKQYLCYFTEPTGNTINFNGNTSINGTNTNTFDTETNCWYMNSGSAGFTLTYAPSVTFSGDWAGTDGKNIDRY